MRVEIMVLGFVTTFVSLTVWDYIRKKLLWNKFLFLTFKKYYMLSMWGETNIYFDLNDKDAMSYSFVKIIAFKGDDFILVNEKYDYNIEGIKMTEDKVKDIIRRKIRTKDDLVLESI